jgi:hypothetical protein
LAFALLAALQQSCLLSEAIAASIDGSNDATGGHLQNWFAEWAALGWFYRPPAEE